MKSSFFAFLFCALFLFGSSACEQKSPTKESLPHYGEMPGFQLQASDGSPFTWVSASDQVRIVSFFFASCPHICPQINSFLKTLHEAHLASQNLFLISITVDPERDTPARLAEYSKNYRQQKETWRFLTGKKKDIERLQQSVKLGPAEDPNEHSTRAILVDREGVIRGYYNVLDKEHRENLLRDIEKLFRST